MEIVLKTLQQQYTITTQFASHLSCRQFILSLSLSFITHTCTYQSLFLFLTHSPFCWLWLVTSQEEHGYTPAAKAVSSPAQWIRTSRLSSCYLEFTLNVFERLRTLQRQRRKRMTSSTHRHACAHTHLDVLIHTRTHTHTHRHTHTHSHTQIYTHP